MKQDIIGEMINLLNENLTLREAFEIYTMTKWILPSLIDSFRINKI